VAVSNAVGRRGAMHHHDVYAMIEVATLAGVRTQVEGTRPLTYEIDGRLYSCSPGSEEFALVARFTPDGSARRVILICGQTALSNRAAVSYLKREHRTLARTLPRPAPVCAHAPDHREQSRWPSPPTRVPG